MPNIKKILSALFERYPNPTIELRFSNPLELLVATILSAQATDKKVNEITEVLFKKYKTPKDYADADLSGLENDIKSINFYKNKAKMIKGCCQRIIDDFGGNIPNTVQALTSLPGIGRKTANVILANAFNIDAIAVDTHVLRVSNRLGLVKEKNPDKVEQILMDIVPKGEWARFCKALTLHGRYTCKALKPDCNNCCLSTECEFYRG
ncbi:MAG: endonuclease III [Thermodesulfovibrionales bacterium]|nr:endonuclease III [Thermodesulfovibrionales bacterium]